MCSSGSLEAALLATFGAGRARTGGPGWPRTGTNTAQGDNNYPRYNNNKKLNISRATKIDLYTGGAEPRPAKLKGGQGRDRRGQAGRAGRASPPGGVTWRWGDPGGGRGRHAGVPEVTEGQLQREGGDLEGSPGGPGTPEGGTGVVEVTRVAPPRGERWPVEPLRAGGGGHGPLQWDRNDTGTFSGVWEHSDGFSRGMEMAPGPFSRGLGTPQVSQVPPGPGWDISRGIEMRQEPPGVDGDRGQTPPR